MLRNCLTVVLLAGLCLPVGAQTEVDVNPLTGNVGVNIPLGKVYSGGLEIPVGLAYRGGGVRVTDGESTAGMSWNLNSGAGFVSREVRGLPDEFNYATDVRKGWMYTSNRQALVNFNPSADNGCTAWGAFNQFDEQEDTEPDIFYFTAPGLSGRFVFDNNNEIRPIPYQDVAITYTTTNTTGSGVQLASFTIVNDHGVRYTFARADRMTRRPGVINTYYPDRDRNLYFNSPVQNSPWYNYQWNLTSITGPNGESVAYTYTLKEDQGQKNFKKVNAGLTKVDTVYREQDIIETSMVMRIEASLYTVDFTWAYNDRISSVKFSAEGISREFTFVYQLIKNPAENTLQNEYFYGRDYLVKVFEQNGCDAFPAYTFEYYNPEGLPYKARYPQDFFGYFNNQSVTQNLSLIPATYQNNSFTNGEQYRIYPKSGYTALVSSTARNVNPSTSYYGCLKKIKYPSGGFSELTYEPNEFYDAATSSNAYGAGVRVASLRVSDGDSDTSNDQLKTYEYKNADGTSSGHWLYPPIFAFSDGVGTFISPDNLAPDQSIYYDRASIIYSGNGRLVYEYLTPARYPVTGSGDWTATKSRLVSQVVASCPSQGNLVAGYYSFPFAPNMFYDFEQGLVSKVQHLNVAGKIVREQLFTYERLNRTATTIKALKFEKANISGAYAYGLYTILANLDKPIKTETVKEYDDVSATLNVSAATNYVYQTSGRLQERNLINSDGISRKTQYTYAGDFVATSPAVADLNARMIRKLQKANMQASVLEVTQWVGTALENATLNLYDSFATNYAYLKAAYAWGGTGTFQPAALSAGSAQQFTWDPGYYVVRSYEGYTVKGQPTVMTDRTRKVQSVLYAKDNFTPAAAIINARPNQVVFSDFENSQAYQLASSNQTDAWSGNGAYRLAANTPITKSSLVKTQSLGYRFRCRAKATTSTAITLTLKLTNTTGGWNTITFTYPAAQSDKWLLLDQTIPMSAVAATFQLQLTASATLTVDDVVFYPDNGTLTSTTLAMLRGKTSETDNRGSTTFYEYDWLGRPAYIRDTNKDILEAHEYRYAVMPMATPKAGFDCTGCDALITGNSITLVARENCVSPVTYTWKVNDIVVGTGNQVTYTFPSARDYRVELTVTHPQFGSNTVSTVYSVQPKPFSMGIAGNLSAIQFPRLPG